MLNLRLLLVLFTTIHCAISSQDPRRFRVIREWKYINFSWPSEEIYNTAISTGFYIPVNNIIGGIKYFEDHFYITLPRMKRGVPVTLARIPAGNTKDTAPLFEPYPSWEASNMEGCNSFQNIQNIEIDAKGMMWIIDGGRVGTLESSPTTKCQPKLVVYDIRNNVETLTYVFPDEVASKGGSYLQDIVLDDADGGYAYITDNSNSDPGIIVYSVRQNQSWKIRHSQSMRSDPMATHFVVNGISINAPINIAAIALGPKHSINNKTSEITEDRTVYYSPLSSFNLYAINSSILRNAEFGRGEYQGSVITVGRKPSQCVSMTMDNKGILYMGLLANNSIIRWDSHLPFETGLKRIGYDDEYIQWPNSFAFDQAGNILVVSNKLHKFIYENMNIDENNFRILQAHCGTQSYLYDESAQMHNQDQQPDQSTNEIYSDRVDNNNNNHNTTQNPSSAPYIVAYSIISLMSFVVLLL